MTIACDAPDPSLGVALRLATYMDCQGRALGENGFLAVAGGPVAGGLLSGLVTIFVALIGYRLLLGEVPSLRTGVGWAARLGIVLALATGWPAFQVLVYRVAVDGPAELAGLLLPATGLPLEDLDGRVQQAYDTIRLGSGDGDAAGIQQQGQPPQQSAGAGAGTGPTAPQQAPASAPAVAPLPQTASIFAVSTVGIAGGLRIAVGLLLALGPLAILGLLFDATLGLFSGWVRALAGAAIGLLAAVMTTTLDLVAVEGELARVQAQSQALGFAVRVDDPQAVTTIVLLFAIVVPVAVIAAARMAAAFRLDVRPVLAMGSSAAVGDTSVPRTAPVPLASASPASTAPSERHRATAVADALAASVRRQQAGATATDGASRSATAARRMTITTSSQSDPDVAALRTLGIAGRRSIGRRTRSAAAREGRR